jgi:hypothetical protein
MASLILIFPNKTTLGEHRIVKSVGDRRRDGFVTSVAFIFGQADIPSNTFRQAGRIGAFN